MSWSNLQGQLINFDLRLEPINIVGLPGLQSYAFGQSDGKWLIAGGRLDGLHQRQPFASFDTSGNNKQIYVVDPILRRVWKTDISTLSITLQEQLSSTNMEFLQKGAYLYLIGGYGYHSSTASKLTFGQLTSIDVSGLIGAIISGGDIRPYFRSVSDERFAVTGGHLNMINGIFYLVGGQRFDGNYNPMGHPTYSQKYTNAIRKFSIEDDGKSLNITHFPEVTDAVQLHRRDYNAVAQILPNGEEGITAFSGVFQPNVDLPFLNCVNIDRNGYSVQQSFQQYYNHYHCAVLPLYDSKKNEMHSIFFGGIAQYYDNAGTLVQDNNVPFVKTIARITRSDNGRMAEYKMPLLMPGYLGASSEFIINDKIPHFDNHVLKLDQFTGDTVLVGYIFGGIRSDAPNIFNSSLGDGSDANSVVYAVTLIQDQSLNADDLNVQSIGNLAMQVYPNPGNGLINIRYFLSKPMRTKVMISNENGTILYQKNFRQRTRGFHDDQISLEEFGFFGPLWITIETPIENATQMLIIKQN